MKSLFATLALLAAVVAAKADDAGASPSVTPAATATAVASASDVAALTGAPSESQCVRAWMCTATGAIYDTFSQCRAGCGAPLGSGACESLEWGC